MRKTRHLALLAAAVLAALALTANTASAFEVTAETGAGTGVHCSPLTAGDHTYTQTPNSCLINVVGRNVELTDFIGIMHPCDWVLTGRLNERGEGFFYAQLLQGRNCDIAPEFEADRHTAPWPTELTFERSGGAGIHTMELVFSVTGAFGIIARCHLNGLQITQTSHTLGSMATTPAGTHVRCETSNAVMGTWTVTSPGRGIEII